MTVPFLLSRLQHILNKNPISDLRVRDQNVGHRSHDLFILDDGAAAHG